MAKVFITAPGRGAKTKLASIDDSELDAAVTQGWQQVSAEEADRLRRVSEASPIAAGAEAVARGVSFGLSDSGLVALGRDPEVLAAGRERLGDAGTLLEVGGAVAPAILSGGAGAAGTAARLTPAGRAAVVGGRITRGTEAALGGGTVAKLAGSAAGVAAEGAAYGVGSTLSEAALGGPEITGQRLLSAAAGAGGLGGLLGVVGRGAALTAPAAGRVAQRGFEAAKNAKAEVAGLAAGILGGPKAGWLARRAAYALPKGGKVAPELEAQVARGAASQQLQRGVRAARKANAYDDLISGAARRNRSVAEAEETSRRYWGAADEQLARAEMNMDVVRAAEARIVKEAERQIFKGKVKTAAIGAVGAVAKAGRPALPVAVTKATTPEGRKKDILAVRDRVNAMAANPLVLADVVRDDALMAVAPNAARERILTTSRGIAYLKSIEPPTYRPPFSGSIELVDQFALAQYERQLQAAIDPHAVLRVGIRNGTLTVDQVDAVHAVYPKVLERVRTEVLQRLGAAEEAGEAVEHAARVQLGILLGMPLDSSLQPDNFAQIQQSVSLQFTANQPPRPSKNPNRPARTGDDGRLATESQRREGGTLRR